MIEVYFETVTGSYSELVAKFANDELYYSCLEALEASAHEQGYIVTESVTDKDICS